MKKNKHPKGLPYLFFAEMWERFGYYLMIGIFVLYMTDTRKGGMGFDRATATDIFGTFIALVFLTPFIGGLLADRKFGLRRSITAGGIMMGLGYMGLAVPGQAAFYISMLLIIVGNGFFKPNISTLLGNLYDDPEYKPLKDSGYNIFYMGINIGAFICNFFAAYLRHNYGWSFAFIGAGIGMFLGIIIFWMGMKHYRHADIMKEKKKEDASLTTVFGAVIFPAFIAGFVGWLIPGNIFGSDSTDAFIFGALPVLFYYISLWVRASKEDREPIAALLSIFAVVIVFWAIFKQNGTALTTWAEFYTDREMPAMIAGPAEKLNMTQQISASPDSFPLYDEQFRTTKENGVIVKALTKDPYLQNLPPDKHPQEGENLNLISTELFQSVNPFFVVILTPVVVAFFRYLSRRGKEPPTPAKIAWGLVVSSLSTLVMVAAVFYCHNGMEKASPWWLFGSYAVITIGELFLSPMGLSLVSKLSPPRLTALMMGGWFLSTSIGNKLSGVLAGMWDGYENKANFFLVNFVLLACAAIIIFCMLKWLNRIFRKYAGT